MVRLILFFFIITSINNFLFAENEYYLTLRADKVNLRQGPSMDHPIKLVYKKKFFVVIYALESARLGTRPLTA